MSADKKETGFFRTRGSEREGMIPDKMVREPGPAGNIRGGSIGSACVFVCAIRYVSARKPYECVFMCGCACGRPYTRQAGTYILGGCARVHRPIGSKRSLSTRVSWTHASRTRRGLGPPLLECFFFRSLHFLCSRHIRISYRHVLKVHHWLSRTVISLLIFRCSRASLRNKQWDKYRNLSRLNSCWNAEHNDILDTGKPKETV